MSLKNSFSSSIIVDRKERKSMEYALYYYYYYPSIPIPLLPYNFPRYASQPNSMINDRIPRSSNMWKNSSWKLRRCVSLFLHLIDHSSICEFLHQDEDFRQADKYLLAMVFIYFSRAKLREHHYTKESFYIALWLAHDSVEEDLTAKYALLPWVFQINDHRAISDIKSDFQQFLTKKNDLWTRMAFRARVTKDQCDEIISIQPNHWIWQRQRSDDYQEKLALFNRRHVDENTSMSSTSTDQEENQFVPMSMSFEMMEDEQ